MDHVSSLACHCSRHKATVLRQIKVLYQCHKWCVNSSKSPERLVVHIDAGARMFAGGNGTAQGRTPHLSLSLFE